MVMAICNIIKEIEGPVIWLTADREKLPVTG